MITGKGLLLTTILSVMVLVIVFYFLSVIIS